MTLPPLQSGLRRNLSPLGPGLQRFDHVFVHRAARRDDEGLAHLREGLRVDRDAIAHRVAAYRKVIGPAHHVDARALGGQRKHRKRIGILAANQRAHRTEFGLEGPEGVAEAAHMDEPFADRRHDFWCLPISLPSGPR
jgi:hypothetical protein